MIPPLAAGPARFALVEEGRHTLLRVGGERVHAHNLLGVGVGFGLVEIDLGVEGLFAERDDE